MATRESCIGPLIAGIVAAVAVLLALGWWLGRLV
jgi:hypothetical protein